MFCKDLKICRVVVRRGQRALPQDNAKWGVPNRRAHSIVHFIRQTPTCLCAHHKLEIPTPVHLAMHPRTSLHKPLITWFSYYLLITD